MVNWRQLLRPGGRLVAVDGFWFTEWDDEDVPALFADHYNADTRSELPLMHLDRPEPILDLLTAAGFISVAAEPRPDLGLGGGAVPHHATTPERPRPRGSAFGRGRPTGANRAMWRVPRARRSRGIERAGPNGEPMPETPFDAIRSRGDADVAFQAVGDADLDLLYFHGAGSHFEHFWDMPEYAAFLGRLMKFSRLILFDRRGTGGSDDVPRSDVPTWEEWTEDVRAVLDAAGSTRTAIFASGDAGPIAMLFAAMHPERVGALVLFNTTARYLVADDYPIGVAPSSSTRLSSWWAKHGNS
jgi:hypothetical protein